MAGRGGFLFYVAKVLEGAGLVVVLVGLVLSIRLGLQEEGLASMRHEGIGLLVGGGLFALGWALERAAGAR
jgi:hypothetical protein